MDPPMGEFPPVICGGLIEAIHQSAREGSRFMFPPVICGGLIEACRLLDASAGPCSSPP